ncbi:MAG: glycosyltransferase [Anaerolineales bacterium]|nr:glycosyltransferase [Anaerolineales bacterium]
MGPQLLLVGVSQLERYIIVDDGSTDRTAEIVRDMPGATVVQHPVNSGPRRASGGYRFRRFMASCWPSWTPMAPTRLSTFPAKHDAPTA